MRDFVSIQKLVENLFGYAQGQAIVSEELLLPQLRKTYNLYLDSHPDGFVHFMFIAGIGTALVLMKEMPTGEKVVFDQLLESRLNAYHQHGWEAVSDFIELAHKLSSNGFNKELSIGLWVLWNIEEKEPSDDKLPEAEAIGRALYISFKGWDELLKPRETN